MSVGLEILNTVKDLKMKETATNKVLEVADKARKEKNKET